MRDLISSTLSAFSVYILRTIYVYDSLRKTVDFQVSGYLVIYKCRLILYIGRLRTNAVVFNNVSFTSHSGYSLTLDVTHIRVWATSTVYVAAL